MDSRYEVVAHGTHNVLDGERRHNLQNLSAFTLKGYY